MKVWIGLGVAALLCLAAYSLWPESEADKVRADSFRSHAVARDDATEIKVMSVAEESLQLNSAEIGADEDIAILDLLLHHYRRVYETNPVGLNHEITRALVGGNPKRAAFLSPTHPAISESGELLDRWGRPFFFHQISGTEMEVVSAGPDGELRTADDVMLE